MNSQQYEEDYAPRGLWSRMRERVFGTEDSEIYAGDEDHGTEPRRRGSLRLDSSRYLRVDVRRNAAVFNDARVAADGLKNGQQQIVNLENATPQMAERILDFLNGVTYALDGCVEKIGERVFLFAPANVHVEIDAGSEGR